MTRFFTRNSLTYIAIGALSCNALAACVAPDKTVNGHTAAKSSWDRTSTPSVPTTTVAPPVPADFVVGVIITEQKCFGSAGCSYHYTVDPQYVNAKPLPNKTTVIFTVTGGDQDQIGNFSIDKDGTATFDRETMIDGPAGADLRATVTQVLPGR